MANYILGGVTGGLGRQLLKLSPMSIPVGRQDCNVTNANSVQNWTESIVDTVAHVINLTGFSKSAMLHKSDPMDLIQAIDVNILGNVRLLKYLRPLFKARPGSTFTMVGSVTTNLAPAGTAIYTASKAALEGLCKVAAKEFAPFGRVNLLELGYFDAGIIDQVPIHPKIPLARLGNAADLAAAWKFIRECEYLTGSIIPINGGL